jgi:hypothetical protein
MSDPIKEPTKRQQQEFDAWWKLCVAAYPGIGERGKKPGSMVVFAFVEGWELAKKHQRKNIHEAKTRRSKSS